MTWNFIPTVFLFVNEVSYRFYNFTRLSSYRSSYSIATSLIFWFWIRTEPDHHWQFHVCLRQRKFYLLTTWLVWCLRRTQITITTTTYEYFAIKLNLLYTQQSLQVFRGHGWSLMDTGKDDVIQAKRFSSVKNMLSSRSLFWL